MANALDSGSVTCVTDSGHHAAIHRLHGAAGGGGVAWLVRAVHPMTAEVRYFGPFPDIHSTQRWVTKHFGAMVLTDGQKATVVGN